MFEASARIRSIPAAAVVVGVAAAAWVALAAGAGHATHHEVLGSGHLPGPAAVTALLGGWLLMAAAMMLPPELAPAGGTGGGITGGTITGGTITGGARRWWAEAGVVTATTCAVWTGFGIAALTGDAALHGLTGSRPWLADLVAPALLIAAGGFHLSPLRRRRLAAARCPSTPAWRHALCCVGSCGALMVAGLAIGVGDLRWMAALSAVMTLERAAGPGLERLAGSLVGWALIGAGALALIQPGLIG